MSIPGGQTPDSCLLASFEDDTPETPFIVSYLDFSRGPETELWIFSSLEIPGRHQTPEEDLLAEQQILALLVKAQEIETVYTQSRMTPGAMLIGSLHETVFNIIQKNELTVWSNGPYQKFIFETSSLPEEVPFQPERFSWGKISTDDIDLVLSRTEIPRKEFVCGSCME
jgi:hypothetical protein